MWTPAGLVRESRRRGSRRRVPVGDLWCGAGDSIRRGTVAGCGREPAAGPGATATKSGFPRAAAWRGAVRGVVCGLTDLAERPSGYCASN